MMESSVCKRYGSLPTWDPVCSQSTFIPALGFAYRLCMDCTSSASPGLGAKAKACASHSQQKHQILSTWPFTLYHRV